MFVYFDVLSLWRQNDLIHKNFWWIWIQGLKIALSTKFELDQVIYLENNSSFFVFFIPKNDVTHRKQKVAMATSDQDSFWQNMQNEHQKCKIKIQKVSL